MAGFVTGDLVQIDRTGPSAERFDLVVVADGFTDATLGAFVATVRAVRRELHRTRPFSTLRGLMNLARVDRTGPADLGAVHRLDDGRLMTVDEDRALAVVAAAGAQADAVLVVVASPRYAGSGGRRVAAVTTHDDAPRLALHELGHTVFDLADEYGGDGPAASGPGEPPRVNVTRVADPSAVKWADLVTSDGVVGCWEGGDRTSRGVYRPSETCLMRRAADPFCAVCEREVARRLLGFAHPAPPE